MTLPLAPVRATPRAVALTVPSSLKPGPWPRKICTSLNEVSVLPNVTLPRISTKSPSLMVPEPETCT